MGTCVCVFVCYTQCKIVHCMYTLNPVCIETSLQLRMCSNFTAQCPLHSVGYSELLSLHGCGHGSVWLPGCGQLLCQTRGGPGATGRDQGIVTPEIEEKGIGNGLHFRYHPCFAPVLIEAYFHVEAKT